MSIHNIYNCISCKTGESGFKFCSGICDLPEYEALIKVKNKQVQFINDNHDVELFCKLSNSNKNLFNHYYTGENEFSSKPFDLPIIRISKIRKTSILPQS
jgi:hypothetical protein